MKTMFGLALSACLAATSAQAADCYVGANRHEGQFERSTGHATYEVGCQEDVVAEAPKAAPKKVVPATCPNKPVLAKSAHAVGKPCLTTEEFVASLKLSKKRQALALKLLKKAKGTATAH